MLSQEQFKEKAYKKFTFVPVSKYSAGKMGVTQWFGQNAVNFYSKFGLKGHTALDIKSRTGTECYAPYACEVTKVVHDPEHDGQLGEYVLAKTRDFKMDGDEWFLEFQWYHLHKSLVRRGDKLKAGEVVALTGNTGEYTTGAHLHFQVRVYRKVAGKYIRAYPSNGYASCIDPYPFFKARDFTGRPPGEPRIVPGALIKSKGGADHQKVYYVKNKRELYWIENGETFEEGHDLGWWGTWTDIIVIDGQLESSKTIKII